MIEKRVRQAASLCGALPEVWHQMHEAHRDRRVVTVTVENGSPVTGPITGLSNDGFTIAVGAGRLTLPWREAKNVELGERHE